MSTFLEATGVRHRYPGTLSLDVPHIGAARGSVLCLLGPSGTGKSTLLRILGLLERPAEGTVRIDGVDVSTRSVASRRRIASAMQSAVLWRGTVRSNVEFGLGCRGVARPPRRRRAIEALAEVGLENLAGRRPSDLSGGERQRVALARVLAVEPEILLLDEPLAHVDEPSRESLALKLRKFTLRTGSATVWVTHDRAEALSVADRIAVIDEGRLLQVGDASEVFTRPSSATVARLVGADNVVSGIIAESRTGIARVDAGPTEIEAVSEFPAGTEVMVLIRPEAISIFKHPPGGGSPRNRYAGTIEEIVRLGPVARIHVAAPVPLVSLVTLPALEEMGLTPGSPVWLEFKATSAHVVRRY